jgi:hypothetical protein
VASYSRGWSTSGAIFARTRWRNLFNALVVSRASAAQTISINIFGLMHEQTMETPMQRSNWRVAKKRRIQ